MGRIPVDPVVVQAIERRRFVGNQAFIPVSCAASTKALN